MAGRGVRGPPYHTALHLIAWAITHAAYVNGRLRLAGFNPDTVTDLAELLDLIHALFAEANPQHLAAVDEALGQPFWVERDQWGRGTAAEAGHAAMMALSGGPAPRRPAGARRPERRADGQVVEQLEG